jgi:diaminopimelate epimerase
VAGTRLAAALALPFQKWQALGNDYVIVERDRLPFELTPARVRHMCAAHVGCHSDGVLELSPPSDERFVARLRIFNPDGSEAELSGNGVREAVLYLRREGWTDSDEFAIETAAGEVRPTITSPRTCRVEMGRAGLRSPDFPSGGEDGRGSLSAGGREFEFQHVSIGNPQCAIRVEQGLDELDLPAIGPPIERSELFPNRTNVSFFRVEGAGRVRARIFERGVGETLSSGTGASGAAVAAVLEGTQSPVTVVLDGGELEVDVGPDLDVTLTGWAEPVFSGEFSDEFVRALEDAE